LELVVLFILALLEKLVYFKFSS